MCKNVSDASNICFDPVVIIGTFNYGKLTSIPFSLCNIDCIRQGGIKTIDIISRAVFYRQR